jgi:hypothetical protein
MDFFGAQDYDTNMLPKVVFDKKKPVKTLMKQIQNNQKSYGFQKSQERYLRIKKLRLLTNLCDF